jgi:hypothetical protein
MYKVTNELTVAPLGTALLNIPNTILYLGSMSRAKFYADILPHLETIKIGKRTMIVKESIDKFINAHRVDHIEPKAKYIGWTCMNCAKPVAGPYAKCTHCGHKPPRSSHEGPH